MLLWRKILSSFFSATKTAGSAIYAEFKVKAYYNGLFHLDAISSFFCHILRALYNLAALLFRVFITPFSILNPLSWPSLPDHFINLVDDLAGFSLSLVSIVIHPFIFLCRTLSTMIFGYEEHTEYDCGIANEEEDLNMAMAIW